ncbi:hypothetical protein AB9F45_36660, partial [Rhizobium leguminosarum]
LNDIGPVLEADGLAQIRDYLNSGRRPAYWNEAADILKENHGASFAALAKEDWREMALALYRYIVEDDGFEKIRPCRRDQMQDQPASR